MTMEEEGKSLADLHAAMDRVREDGNAIQFTLKNGIVLRCRAVPPIYMRTLAERFTPPPPPQVRIERGDDSYYEENRDDPDWNQALKDNAARAEKAITQLVFGMGTEIVSVPEGYVMPDDDAWVAKVRRADKFTGVETPLELDDPDLRYICWLQFYALDNNTDVQLAGLLPQFLAGPSEVEIAQAVDAFRDHSQRRADPDDAVADADTDGNNDNRASRRRRSRVRPTGSGPVLAPKLAGIPGAQP